MSIFKKLFGQASSPAPVAVPVENMATNRSTPPEARGREIAAAYNRSEDIGLYLKFRDAKLRDLEQQFRSWQQVDDTVKKLWQQDVQHAQNVQQLSQAGDDSLLKNASRLQGDAADLRLRRAETQKLVRENIHEQERLQDIFTVLVTAESGMQMLPEAAKSYSLDALKAVQKHGAALKNHANTLPGENKSAENAIKDARAAEIARANQQRADADAAVAEAEAKGRKVKFNEYLNNGLSTGNAIKAPKTARFTRKPKTVSTP